jgi:branched-chain amino acid transport system ATP-binding protein
MSAVLQTSGLGISFGGFRAVSDVNLRLEAGARQALIGPNGAGKTTLINLLTGVLRPTQGSIHLGGQELTHVSADRRARLGLSRTFQINTLFPRMTPLESVVAAVSEREGVGGVWWRSLRSHGTCSTRPRPSCAACA